MGLQARTDWHADEAARRRYALVHAAHAVVVGLELWLWQESEDRMSIKAQAREGKPERLTIRHAPDDDHHGVTPQYEALWRPYMRWYIASPSRERSGAASARARPRCGYSRR
jgi:hypothetical protein